jgi:hypothetical protein
MAALRAAGSVVEVRALVAAVHHRGEGVVRVHDRFDEDQPGSRRPAVSSPLGDPGIRRRSARGGAEARLGHADGATSAPMRG